LRRLIVNADDFGLTSGVNRAIAEAHQRGIVTSTTLMANGSAFTDAVTSARTMPRLSVGCHVGLVDGSPILPADRVRGLVDENGRFPAGFGSIAKSALRKKLDPVEIEAEVTAQIRKIQQAGLTVSHVDSHKHVHMLPLIGGAIIRAAQSCGVRAIRNPFVPIAAIAFIHVARRPKLWTRYTETRLLRRFHSEFRELVVKAEMFTTDGSFGVISTGTLDPSIFDAIAASIPEGTWEFVCHPGYVDAELGKVRTRLRESREQELSILTSEQARTALAKHGVELISYADLIAT
jgi:chitin disaccharide deacetylase